MGPFGEIMGRECGKIMERGEEIGERVGRDYVESRERVGRERGKVG